MNHKQLVQNLVDNSYLKSSYIVEAFRYVDRQYFVRQDNLPEAYGDYPLPIGSDQTISQPRTVAFMIELLSVQRGDLVLDIGAGSGWTTALLAHIVGDEGFVYATEIVPELVDFARENLVKFGTVNVEVWQAKSGQLGLPDKGPYDKILVSASGDEMPQGLLSQLKVGGRIVIPIYDAIWKIEKISETETEEEKYSGFAFVPLKY